MLITFITETVLGFVASASVLILAIVEVAKQSGLNSRYAPAVSVLAGILIGVFFAGYETVSWNILAGLIAGLSASGIYSGVKKTVGK